MTSLNRFFSFVILSTLLFGYLKGPVPPSNVPTPPCAEVSNPQYIYSSSDFKWSFFGGSTWGATVPKGPVKGACWVEDESQIVDAIEKSKHPFLILAAHGFMDGDIHRFDIGGRDVGSAQFTNWDKPILLISCMGDERKLEKLATFSDLGDRIKKMKRGGYSVHLGTEGFALRTSLLQDVQMLLFHSNMIWNNTN